MTEKGFFSLRPKKPEKTRAAGGRKLMKPCGELNRKGSRFFNGFCSMGGLDYTAGRVHSQAGKGLGKKRWQGQQRVVEV